MSPRPAGSAELLRWVPPPPPQGFDPTDVMPPRINRTRYPLASLAPDISGACNLACVYCAEASSQPTRAPMDANVLEQTWRMLALAEPRVMQRSLRFGSGEPLLNLDRLKQLHALIERDVWATGGPSPEVSITTNGTMIDDEVAAWLASTGWGVKLSIDGPREMHDRQRRSKASLPTYQKVRKALDALLARCPEQVSAAAVLCRDCDPEEVFESIEELGVRRIELVPVVTLDPSLRPSLADHDAYDRFVTDYAASLARESGIPRAVLVRFRDCVRRVMGYDNQAVRCGAGRNFFGVSSDGGLYPCFRFVGLEDFRMGDVATGIDPSRQRAFQSGAGRPSYERRPCVSCWAAPLCCGPCFSCSELFGAGEPIEDHCRYVIADAQAAVRLVETLRNDDPEKLLSYLPPNLELP